MPAREDTMSDVRADPGKMVWPWKGHESCQVHRILMHGEECGRICKRCNVVEYHFLASPGPMEVEGFFDIESVPSGSA